MKRRHLCAAAAVALLSSATLVRSQQRVNDYFAPNRDNHLLQSNESHHKGKGIWLLRNGSPGYAKQEFDFILGIWPNHPEVLALMADTLLLMGKPVLIDPYFERAYQLTPNVAQLLVVHGATLLRMNRVDAAIEQLQRGVELDDDSINGHYNLGLALVRAKRFDEANRHAQRAYALGHPLPGLRDQLQKAKAWKPEAAAAPAEPDKKTQ